LLKFNCPYHTESNCIGQVILLLTVFSILTNVSLQTLNAGGFHVPAKWWVGNRLIEVRKARTFRKMATIMNEVEKLCKQDRFLVMRFLIELGFTKRDMQIAMDVNSICTIKDDLAELRIKVPEDIPSHLLPQEIHQRLRNAFVALSYLDDQIQTQRATPVMVLIHSVLKRWLDMQPILVNPSRYPFPTLIYRDGEVIPFEKPTFTRLLA